MENNNSENIKSEVTSNEALSSNDLKETASIEKSREIKKTKFQKYLKSGWELVKFAVIAFVIVMPIRIFIAQPFIVSGSSMYPTFHNNDYLIVDEVSYLVGKPERNDIAIFRYPIDPSRFFIKRVIGLPNEEIDINKGQITIKNKEYPNGFILQQPYLRDNFTFSGTYKTGNNQYFVMGDNRNESLDSRIWGMLPAKDLTGKALFRLFPFNNISYLPGDYVSNK